MGSKTMPRCEFNGKKLILQLQYTIPGYVSAITPMVEGVMNIVRQMKCAEGKDFEVEAAVREALANAVIHGCKNNPGKSVQLCVACDEARGLLIVVRDPGGGFDPDSIPSPVVGQQIYAEHGRGIYLINQLIDEVHFDKGGAEIRMIKR